MKVSVDTDKLLTAADRIEQLQEEYSRQISLIVKCLEDTRSYWSGTDAEKYVEKVQNYPAQLRKLDTVISEYAKFLRKCSDAYIKVDEDVFEQLCRI